MSDVWSLLRGRVRADGASPLVTSLDSEARTELSGASLANAAAKIANALRDTFDLDPGDVIGIDLPLHWQRSAWCAGAWTAGCIVDPHPGAHANLTVVSLDALHRTPDGTGAVVSLHPFGLPITDPLPAGWEDVTIPVRQQPDAYLFEPPRPDLVALRSGDVTWSQGDLIELARSRASHWGLEAGGRLLVDESVDELDALLAGLVVPLVADAAAVLVRGSFDAAQVERRERITARAT